LANMDLRLVLAPNWGLSYRSILRFVFMHFSTAGISRLEDKWTIKGSQTTEISFYKSRINGLIVQGALNWCHKSFK